MKLVEKSADIEVGRIKRSPHFFRDNPAEEDLLALTESIRLKGQIHPVSVVRLLEPSARGREYELINGHRRWLATQQAGLPTIRADVYEFTPEEASDSEERQSSIVRFLHDANMQEPLTPIELAGQFVSLMETFDLSPAEIAKMFHRSVEEVEDTLKFAFIDEKVRQEITKPDNARKVTSEHLRVLASYAAPTKRGWRLNPEQQMDVVGRLLSGDDKRMQESTRLFDKEIRDLKQQARKEKQAANESARTQPDQSLKALFKQVDKIERAVSDLNALPAPGTIGFVDRRALIMRLSNAAQALVEFPDNLPSASESVGAGATAEPAAAGVAG